MSNSEHLPINFSILCFDSLFLQHTVFFNIHFFAHRKIYRTKWKKYAEQWRAEKMVQFLTKCPRSWFDFENFARLPKTASAFFLRRTFCCSCTNSIFRAFCVVIVVDMYTHIENRLWGCLMVPKNSSLILMYAWCYCNILNHSKYIIFKLLETLVVYMNVYLLFILMADKA